MYKSILVTGGAGFIGSNFIRYMLDKYQDAVTVVNLDKLTYAGRPENLQGLSAHPNYHFVKADVCDELAVSRALRDFEVDCVVHFAAESHVDRSIQGPAVFGQTNVCGTLNLLDCCRRFWQSGGAWREGVRYLQISTDEVYGSAPPGVCFDEEAPLRPSSPYSASKAGADHLCRAYFETYGLPVLISRCTNNYGPRQFPEKLIPLMIRCALRGERLPVYGDGLNVRDWLYVEDHCAALDRILQSGQAGQIYNIGGQWAMTNLALVKKLLALLAEKGAAVTPEQIAFVRDRPGHDRRYALNTEKIRRELGWAPRVAPEEGLMRTVSWYLENQSWLQNMEPGGKEYF